MNTPISNPILTVQQPKYTNFSTYDKTERGPYRFEKIMVGLEKGFYRKIPPRILQGKNITYTKAFFPNPIKYHYKDYIPYYDGFYYVPRSDIPIRKLMYGLQNYDMPSSGNTELFLSKFKGISVPRTFCPVIDPCIEDWCLQCQSNVGDDIKADKIRIGFMNLVYLTFTIFILTTVVFLSFFI